MDLVQVRKQSAWDYLLALIVPASILAYHSAFISDLMVLVMSLLNAASIIVMVPWGAAHVLVSTLSVFQKSPLPRSEFYEHINALYSYGSLDNLASKTISLFLVVFALITVYRIRGGKIEAGRSRTVDHRLDCVLLFLNPSAVTARHSKSRLRMAVTDLLEIFTVSSMLTLFARVCANSWIEKLRYYYPDRYASVNSALVLKSLSITAAIAALIAPAPYLLALATMFRKKQPETVFVAPGKGNDLYD
jgi:hypothetical protein